MTEDAGHENHSSAGVARRAALAIRAGVRNLVASLPALTAGAHLGPEAAVAVSALVSSVQEFRSSTREEARETTVCVLAAREIQQRIDAGESVRSDGFFDETAGGRSAGEEAWESVLSKSRQESSERKLPYMAHLLAGIAFDPTVDLDVSHQLIAAAEELTYRQLCLMRLAATKHAYALRVDDYRGQDQLSGDVYPVLYECVGLYQMGFVNFGGEVVFGPTDVKPGAIALQGLGDVAHKLMRLSDIPDDDVAEVAKPLQAG